MDMDGDAKSKQAVYRPFMVLVLAQAAGLVAGDTVPGAAAVAGIGAVFVLAWTAFAFWRSTVSVTAPLVLFFLLGYLSIQPWVSPRFPANHLIHYRDTGSVTVRGRIAQSQLRPDGRRVLYVDVDGVGQGLADPKPAVGRLRVTVLGPSKAMDPGTRIGFPTRIGSVRNFGNPGGFDYQRYLADRKVYATAYAQGSRVTVIEHGHALLAALRQRLAALIDKAIDGPSRELVKALLIGDRSGIPAGLQTAFNRAGVGHLLAISGLHVGIVAAAAFSGGCWLLSWFPALLWPAWTRRAAALLSAVPVVFYGLLAGGSVATQRAVIMALVFLLAICANREQDPFNTLAAAAMLMLAWWPPAFFSISFQLSFAAVFFILLGIRKDPPASNRNIRKLIVFVQVSFWALIGTLPLVAHYFHLVSWVGGVANLILVPMVGFGIVPAGLGCIATGLVAPDLAEIGFHFLGHVAAWAIDLVKWFGSWPHAAVYTVTPSLIEIVLYYALLAWLMMFRRQRKANWALAVILAIGCLDAGYWSWQRFFRNDLRVSYIDVGQGSAALVRLPRGECMLIDGGGFGGDSAFDIGQQVVAPFLWHEKIGTVETLVLSHPNSDHLNGLLFIAEHFHVRQMLMTHDPADLKSYDRLREIIAARAIDAPAFDRLPRLWYRSGVQIAVLHPPRDFLASPVLDGKPDLNNRSLVLRMASGRVSFLFPGDIESCTEAQLVHVAGAQLKSTVLLAPHHGSRTSSSPAFMQRVDPDVVVISAGSGRRLPHPSVMTRYRRRGCEVLETARRGMVNMAKDGDHLEIETFRQVPD